MLTVSDCQRAKVVSIHAPVRARQLREFEMAIDSARFNPRAREGATRVGQVYLGR